MEYFEYLSFVFGIIPLGVFASVFFLIKNHSLSLFSKLFYEKIMGGNLKSKESKKVKKCIKKYIPHNLKMINGEEIYSFKEFIKTVKQQRFIFIVGDAGIGKSTLLMRLAYLFRKNNSHKINRFEDLSIIYYKIRGNSSLESIKEYIKENIKGPAEFSIFIDGFDEMSCLYEHNAHDILGELLDFLDNSEIFNSCKRIIISSRREIFEEGVNSICDLTFNGDPITDIWNIQPFTEKQSLQYIKDFYDGEEKQVVYKRLEKFLESNSQSIFQFPFILGFAEYIFCETDETIANTDLYSAVNIIVNNGLNRECRKYNQQHRSKNNRINEEDYVSQGKDFLIKVAKVMLEDGCQDTLSDEQIDKCIEQNKDEVYLLASKKISTTRRLLKYNDGMRTFSYMHSMLYEFFTAKAILHGNYSRNDRAKLLKTLSASRTLMLEFYHRAALELCENVLDIERMSEDESFDIERIVGLEYVSGEIKVQEVLSIFPFAKSINIERKVVLEDEDNGNKEIGELFSGVLDLSHRHNLTNEILDCFNKDSIECIDATGSKIQSIGKLIEFRKLKYLYIDIETIEKFNELKKLPPSIVVRMMNKLENYSPILILLYKNIVNNSANKQDIALCKVPENHIQDMFGQTLEMKCASIVVELDMQRMYYCLYDLRKSISWNVLDERTYYRYYAFLDGCFFNEEGLFCDLSEHSDKNIEYYLNVAVNIKNSNRIEKELHGSSAILLFFYYGYALFLQCKYEEALQEFLRFIELMEENSEAYSKMNKDGDKFIKEDEEKYNKLFAGGFDFNYIQKRPGFRKEFNHEKKIKEKYPNPITKEEKFIVAIQGERRDLYLECMLKYTPVCYSCVGVCYAKLGNYSSAVNYFNKGIKIWVKEYKSNEETNEMELVGKKRVRIGKASKKMEKIFESLYLLCLEKLEDENAD